MPVIIHAGDLNLPDLAGMVLDLTQGHDLPIEVYVYGVGDGGNADIYLDPAIPHVEQIAAFFMNKGIALDLSAPKRGGGLLGVGISRNMRDTNIRLAAKICAFLLFCIHETILIDEGMENLAANL